MVTVNVGSSGSQSPAPLSARIKADLDLWSIIGHVILWIIIIVITVGVGLFFFPYSFAGYVLNRISVVDPSTGNCIGRLECKMNLASQIGHVILWIIISVVTLGIGYIVYLYKTWGFAMNHTRIVAP